MYKYIQNPKNSDIRVLTRSFTSCSNSETRSNRQFPRFHKTAMRWRSSSSHPTMMSFSWLKSPVLNAVLHRIASVRAYVGRTAVHVIKSNVVCLMCSDRTCPSLLWKFLHHLLPDVSTVKLYCFIFIVFFFIIFFTNFSKMMSTIDSGFDSGSSPELHATSLEDPPMSRTHQYRKVMHFYSKISVKYKKFLSKFMFCVKI